LNNEFTIGGKQYFALSFQ